jgi:taurine dioxygenase
MPKPSFTQFRLAPQTPDIGAEISGIDLAQPIPSQTADELRLALATYDVLFFRGQDLNVEQQIKLAQVFGNPSREKTYFPPSPENELVELVETKPGGPRYNTDQWHNDTSYIQDVPAGAVLAAKVLPESGDDTLWASARKVYRALPSAITTWLEGRTAQHSIDHSGWPEIIRAQSEEKYRAARERHLPVSHPLVKTHPVTGEKYIFANPKYTERIDGLPRHQSNAILNLLFQEFERPEHQVRLRWAPGTLAIWDNHSTQHYAAPDYLPAYRLLHRVTF